VKGIEEQRWQFATCLLDGSTEGRRAEEKWGLNRSWEGRETRPGEISRTGGRAPGLCQRQKRKGNCSAAVSDVHRGELHRLLMLPKHISNRRKTWAPAARRSPGGRAAGQRAGKLILLYTTLFDFSFLWAKGHCSLAAGRREQPARHFPALPRGMHPAAASETAQQQILPRCHPWGSGTRESCHPRRQHSHPSINTDKY